MGSGPCHPGKSRPPGYISRSLRGHILKQSCFQPVTVPAGIAAFPSPRSKIVNEGTPEEKVVEVPITGAALHCALRRNIKGENYHKDKTKNVYKRGPYKISQPETIADPNKIGVEAFTPHDLRRTVATHMSGLGIMEEIIDRVLNHVRPGIIRTYNLNRYDKEKQSALENWEGKLLTIVSDSARG